MMTIMMMLSVGEIFAFPIRISDGCKHCLLTTAYNHSSSHVNSSTLFFIRIPCGPDYRKNLFVVRDFFLRAFLFAKEHKSGIMEGFASFPVVNIAKITRQLLKP